MNGTTDQQVPPPQGPPPSGEQQTRSAFDGLRQLGIQRRPGWIGGVSEGIAARLRIDPLIVRAAFILLGLMLGLGALVYLAAWALLPDQHGQIHAEEAFRHGRAGSVGLIVALGMIAMFAVLGTWAGPGFPAVIGLVGATMALSLVAVAFLRTDTGGAPPPAGHYSPPTGTFDDSESDAGGVPSPAASDAGTPARSTGGTTTITAAGHDAAGYQAGDPPPGPSASGGGQPPHAGFAEPQVRGPGGRPPAGQHAALPQHHRRKGVGFAASIFALGLAVIGGTLVHWLAEDRAWPGNAISIGIAAGVAVLAIFLIVAGMLGRRSAGVSTLAALALPVLLVSLVLPSSQGISLTAGDRTWTPATTNDAGYALGAGQATLDLREVPIADNGGGDPVQIDASVNTGVLRVEVPDDLVVEFTTSVGAGEVTVNPGDGAGDIETWESWILWGPDWQDAEERGVRRSGASVDGRWVSGPDDADLSNVDLRVDLTMTFGQITIEEVSR